MWCTSRASPASTISPTLVRCLGAQVVVHGGGERQRRDRGLDRSALRSDRTMTSLRRRWRRAAAAVSARSSASPPAAIEPRMTADDGGVCVVGASLRRVGDGSSMNDRPARRCDDQERQAAGDSSPAPGRAGCPPARRWRQPGDGLWIASSGGLVTCEQLGDSRTAVVVVRQHGVGVSVPIEPSGSAPLRAIGATMILAPRGYSRQLLAAQHCRG